MRHAKKIVRDSDGVVTLELALILPVFLLLLFGIIEFSIIMFAKSVMEGATSITSRMGKTGYIEEGKSREDMLIDLLEQKSSGILDPERIEIETLVYESFSDISQPEPLTIDVNGNGEYDPADGDAYQDVNGNGAWDEDIGAAGLGGAGDIVVYHVHYPWPVMTPIMSGFLADDDGNYPLDVSVVVRNEPYENGS